MAKDLNVSLGLLTQEFKRGLKSATRDLNNFARKTQSIGRTLTGAITVPLVGAAAGAVKAFAEIDTLKKGLEAVSGSSEAAARQFKELTESAKLPGLDLKQAVKGSISLQAVGFSAEQAKRALEDFGKAAALGGDGSGENLDRVITQLTQIVAKGKILQEDIKPLVGAAPSLNKVFKDAFGGVNAEAINKSTSSVGEFVEKTLEAIEANKAISSFTGGLTNSFVNFGQAIRLAAVDFGALINETLGIQSVLDRISSFITATVDRFKKLSPEVQKTILVIAGLAAAIGPAILAVSGIAAGLATFLNPIGLTITAIAALTAGFVALYNNNEAFRKSVNRVGQVLKAVFIVLAKEAGKAIDFIGQNLAIVRGGLTASKEAFRDFGITGQSVFRVISNSIKNLAKVSLFVADVFAGLAVGLKGIFKEIVTIAQETVSSVFEAFEALKKRDWGQALKSIGDVAATFSTDILEQGKRIGGAFLTGFKDGYNENPIREFYDKVKAEIENQGKEVEEISKRVGEKTFKNTVATSPTLSSGGSGEKEFTPSAQVDQSIIQGLLSRIEFTRTLRTETDGLATGIGRVALQNELVQKTAKEAADAQIKFNKQLNLSTTIADKLTPAFDTFFDTILSGGKDAFGAFKDAIKQVINELIKAVAKAAIFAALTSIIFPGASASAGGFGKLFGGFFGKFTGFADGGIVNRPTRGLVGEAGPEAIIPLDRIFNGGSGGSQQLELRVEGTELVALLKNSESIYNRIF